MIKITFMQNIPSCCLNVDKVVTLNKTIVPKKLQTCYFFYIDIYLKISKP